MEEERIIDDVITPVTEDVSEDITIEPNKPLSTYEKINKLNIALDELANDITVDNELDNLENEISLPEISSEEMSKELADANDESQEELANEITAEEDDLEYDDASSSKGQFILIGILSIILIALLIAMIVFTNAL